MSKIKFIINSISIGLLNGLLGSGGGIIAIKHLERIGISKRNAHACSIFIIVPISFLSLIIYMFRIQDIIFHIMFYSLFGMIGSFIGSYLLRRINNKLLNRIFSIFILYLAIRILIQ